VADWTARISGRESQGGHGRLSCQDRGTIAMREHKTATRISHQQVSRWVKRLGDRAAYHAISPRRPARAPASASAPRSRIARIDLKDAAVPYGDDDFASDITNVNASNRYRTGGVAERAHSDFWHPETLHLIVSITAQIRARAARSTRA